MRVMRTITVVGCHAGGEIGNVVIGGVLPPKGDTVFEQMQTLAREGDSLRKLLLREPRGSVACHANLVVPAPLEVEGLGTITVDVAYGGMWYAIADAHALDFALEPHEARDLSLAGERIRVAAREQLPCSHPENPEIAGVSI